MRIQLLLYALSVLALVSAKKTNDKCWSKKFGIECCKHTKKVVRKTYDGPWGKENGKWCGIGEKSTRPKNDVPPAPPALTDLSKIDDPAAVCDVTDAITGESLAKAAPFRFGVGLNGNAIENSTTSSKTMRDVIKHQFNSVTYSNLMKALFVLNQEGSIKNLKNGKQDPALDFSTFVDGLDFCQKNGIHMRGHVLVWHNQAPKWFFTKNYEEDGEYVDAKTMEYRLESYIKQYLSFVQFNYPGVVDVWDVVNEAVEVVDGKYDNSTGWYTRTLYNTDTPNMWYDIFGPDYVAKTFRIARKYALPNVKLVYNDYSTFVTKPISKRDAIIKLLNILKKENLVDAIGMQSYINPDEDINEYLAAVDEYQKTGLEIQITELTIRVKSTDDWEEYNVQQYSQLFEGLMKRVKKGYNIGSVTVFGLQDGYRFYENDTQKFRLFDHDLKKKKVYHAIMKILKGENATDSESDAEAVDANAETEVGEDSADDAKEL